jgi:cysteine desulfurase/selenocysteine lyase
MSLRHFFPQITSSEHYFDNAATTFMPVPVLRAMDDFNAKSYGSVYRGIYRRAEVATTLYDDVRTKIAHFIKSDDVNTIVFTKGATEGINHVAWSWAFHNLKEGDEIVLTEVEHHANIAPWLEVAHIKKATIRWIPVNARGLLDISQIDSIITSKTKLVACTAVSNVTGLPSPLAEIAKYAQKVGAALLIDAAQAMHYIPKYIHEYNPDFMVFSGHKIHGPSGVGVLYVSSRRHAELKPHYVGGGMITELRDETISYRSMPYMLEAGTPPISAVIGLGAAVDFIEQHITPTVIAEQYHLIKKIYNFLKSHEAVVILGNSEEKRTLLSFSIKNMHPHDVAAYLADHGIAVRAGYHCAQPIHTAYGLQGSVRISLACFNTEEEVDKLINTLSQLLNSLSNNP